jgi:hypothetical protein
MGYFYSIWNCAFMRRADGAARKTDGAVVRNPGRPHTSFSANKF